MSRYLKHYFRNRTIILSQELNDSVFEAKKYEIKYLDMKEINATNILGFVKYDCYDINILKNKYPNKYVEVVKKFSGTDLSDTYELADDGEYCSSEYYSKLIDTLLYDQNFNTKKLSSDDIFFLLFLTGDIMKLYQTFKIKAKNAIKRFDINDLYELKNESNDQIGTITLMKELKLRTYDFGLFNDQEVISMISKSKYPDNLINMFLNNKELLTNIMPLTIRVILNSTSNPKYVIEKFNEVNRNVFSEMSERDKKLSILYSSDPVYIHNVLGPFGQNFVDDFYDHKIMYELFKGVTNKEGIIDILLNDEAFVYRTSKNKKMINSLLYNSTNPNKIITKLGDIGDDYINNLDDIQIARLLENSPAKETLTLLFKKYNKI